MDIVMACFNCYGIPYLLYMSDNIESNKKEEKQSRLAPGNAKNLSFRRQPYLKHES